MIQINISYGINQNKLNEYLRLFQKEHPRYEILNVAANPHELYGWFMVITYKVHLD